MNFFGHAVLARDEADDAGFVFGSMLPDFQSMARARVLRVDEPRVAAGVAHHHRVDDVFHRTTVFVGWMAEAQRELDARGVNWGASRAVSHVGTELLLDGWLLREHETDLYESAIAAADELATGVAWRGEGAPAFDGLLARLRSGGVDGMRRAYQSPENVAALLARILAPRKRLRFGPGEAEIVAEVLRGHLPSIERQGEALLDEVRRGLTALELAADE